MKLRANVMERECRKHEKIISDKSRDGLLQINITRSIDTVLYSVATKQTQAIHEETKHTAT